ncbi:MAG: serine protease [Xanthomonadales bacterium]|nr:serine protease [Xanthomonadales bacterium]
MLQGVSHKFRSGCMMLARNRGEAIDFLGTAFLVHGQGYLLTAAHLTIREEDLVVVPTRSDEEFRPVVMEGVVAMDVEVRQRDDERDVALLRIEQDIDIRVPDDFLGSTETVPPGASVMSLGYSFGYQHIYSLLGFNATISAKIRSQNDTSLILYDSAFHEGDRGGPLIDIVDGHIIGIISGRFEPAEITTHAGPPIEKLEARETNVTYAVAIEYGLDLMRAEGLLPGQFGAP